MNGREEEQSRRHCGYGRNPNEWKLKPAIDAVGQNEDGRSKRSGDQKEDSDVVKSPNDVSYIATSIKDVIKATHH